MESPIDLIISRIKAVKRSGDSGKQWVGLCPAHDDNKHSLGIGVGDDGRVLLKCYRGCSLGDIVRAAGLSERDLFPAKEPTGPEAAQSDSASAKPSKTIITVADLAFDKRLPADWLQSKCGLDTVKERGVYIPYPDEERHVAAVRWRTALRAKSGSSWRQGDKPIPYGCWRLPDVRKNEKFLIIVEGESDCWTLWHHGFPALGLPGANMVGCLANEALEGIEKVYVWREPGDGGEVFVDGIARRLLALEWRGEARMVSGGPVKDANDLHQIGPDEFADEFKKILDASVELPKPSGKAKKIPKAAIIGQQIQDALVKDDIPPPAPGYFDCTDLGNANRLANRFKNRIHYVHQWKQWLIWDGMRWDQDITGEIYRLIFGMIVSIMGEASKAESLKEKERLMNWLMQSQHVSRIMAVEKLARNLEGIPIAPGECNKDPMMMNVLNGTINLHTGELHPHRPENLITKLANVVYDPQCECPTWDSFIHRIMNGRQGLIDFLRVAVGYTLTGCVDEKCFFFLYGDGDNGKSTFMEVLADALSDYQAKTTAETLLAKSNYGGVPNDIARLVGMRMVTASEMPEGRLLDEAKVKDLTGRDTISARFMRAEWFDFRPLFKLWMYGNHRPRIKNADEGIWRRVKMVPFDVVIPKSEQDPQLPDKLRAELSGILNWALRGCLEWKRCGLVMPDEIKSAVADYKSDMDQLSHWAEDCCFLGEKYSATPAVLRNSYSNWCKFNDERPVNNIAFGMWLKRKGCTRNRGTSSHRVWHGVSLNPSNDQSNSHDDKHADEFADFNS